MGFVERDKIFGPCNTDPQAVFQGSLRGPTLSNATFPPSKEPAVLRDSILIHQHPSPIIRAYQGYIYI